MEQWFSTFFKSRNLWKVNDNLAEPKNSQYYFFQGFSGNPVKKMRNFCVPRNPGCKTLIWRLYFQVSMADEVNAELIKIISTFGKLGTERSAALLNNMKDDGRYCEDIFGQ